MRSCWTRRLRTVPTVQTIHRANLHVGKSVSGKEVYSIQKIFTTDSNSQQQESDIDWRKIDVDETNQWRQITQASEEKEVRHYVSRSRWGFDCHSVINWFDWHHISYYYRVFGTYWASGADQWLSGRFHLQTFGCVYQLSAGSWHNNGILNKVNSGEFFFI